VWTHRLCGWSAVAIALFAAPGAQAMTLGEFEYRNSCSQCHGESGRGDGPVAETLKQEPSDLTTLQQDNGGVFPVTRVYAVIEGDADVRVHGPRNMPLWGQRFRARFDDDEYESFSARDTEEFVTARILALVEYLSTIQVE
jgi:mono/diheme cytochrome c family protein